MTTRQAPASSVPNENAPSVTLDENAPSVALDENALTFVATFMTHVAMVAGYPANRIATIERVKTIVHVKTLLLAAMADRDGDSSSAWSTLHRTIAEIVATSNVARNAHGARAYLETFVQENHDLAVSNTQSSSS
jgi:hypothetical protein